VINVGFKPGVKDWVSYVQVVMFLTRFVRSAVNRLNLCKVRMLMKFLEDVGLRTRNKWSHFEWCGSWYLGDISRIMLMYVCRWFMASRGLCSLSVCWLSLFSRSLISLCLIIISQSFSSRRFDLWNAFLLSILMHGVGYIWLESSVNQ